MCIVSASRPSRAILATVVVLGDPEPSVKVGEAAPIELAAHAAILAERAARVLIQAPRRREDAIAQSAYPDKLERAIAA